MRSRRSLFVLTLAIGLALATQAQASDLRLQHAGCGFSTDYAAQMGDHGLSFERAGDRPVSVLMHDGSLRVDGHAVAVSDADAARLREYEHDVRTLLPEVADIAREGLDIGFSAMTTVAATFTEDADQRQRMLATLKAKQVVALEQLDRVVRSGSWKQDEIGRIVEDGVEGSVDELVGAVTADAMKATLSGDQRRIAALEARADSLDKALNREVEARVGRLDQRAQALCPRLSALEQLQQQFQFRLPDGSRLQLMSLDRDSHDQGRRDKLASR